MNILLDSASGDSFPLGLRLQAEGHDVTLAIDRQPARRIGEGLIAKTTDPIAYAREEADLVIADQVGRGAIHELLREAGVPVLGAGAWLDRLELDRILALKLARAAGIAIPPTEFFEDADTDRALAFIRAHADQRYVFKASGNIDTSKTFVAHDAEEMLEYLEHVFAELKGKDAAIPPFVLQEVVDGVEISTERWWARGVPVPALDNHTLEEKRWLAGDYGPHVGCAGNVLLPTVDAPLIAATVARLDRLAATHQVSGPIDINAIVDPAGRPWLLEFTARFGYDALQAFLTRWQMPLGETLYALATGEVPPVALASGWAAAVRVSVPPYPDSDHAETARGIPVVDDILDLTEGAPQVWPGDVMLDAAGQLVVAGADGVVYVVTAVGPTIAAAYGPCYDFTRAARLPDRQVRSDLVERAEARVAQLRAWGFFRERPRSRLQARG